MNRDLVLSALKRHRELFNAGDRDRWLANLADEPVLEEPVGSAVRRGWEHFAQIFDVVHLTPGLRLPEPDIVVVSGREAAISFKAPAGTDRLTDVVEIFTVGDDGRIAGVRTFIDPEALPT
ncbi:nuclear transport factor 2 family protein [Mycobacterium avium]|uniref:nuclear transport factor 2 family protein n=1 Tax=Mycobacterium avium TaxID=1764 RepID=UPI00079FF1EB|nr:nuclear transport factor 2 family protein [Mycobacterium avium]MDV3290055.1 nuclear transport factor 2 family protein [Mycobacterium avium subsp. hominissuis]